MLGIAGAAVAVAAVLAWPRADKPVQGSPLDDPAEPALEVGSPRELDPGDHVSFWTTVRRAVPARSAPNPGASRVAPVAVTTPEGTPNTLLVLGRTTGAGGRVWLHVRLAVLPNGTTAWVPRSATRGYRAVRTRLTVSLGAQRLTLRRNGRRLLTAPVGIGLPQWPTPSGRFYVRNKLVRYRGGFYGPLAFGTSARSAVLTDWPDGGFVGIHGTNRPGEIPGRVSHGCIRMRNRDIVRLGRLMPVGTPIEIS